MKMEPGELGGLGDAGDRGDSPSFQDHFSAGAEGYRAHRPTYPPALVAFLAKACARRELAWEAGCGSGQLSTLLGGAFERVIATDLSAEQLARADAAPRVEYRVAAAESSGLEPSTVDLAVSAQAAHWFDLDRYYAEVRRVARPDGLVALVGYGLMDLGDDLAPLVLRFHREVLGPWWPRERVHVDSGYRTLAFPFTEIATPSFSIERSWSLAQVLGYVSTWSAVRRLEAAAGREESERFAAELGRAWGGKDVRAVRWPVALRVGPVAS